MSDMFAYLQPTASQLETLVRLRAASKAYADTLEHELPPGPDKTFAIRELRTVAMWANVAATRNADGSPHISAPQAPQWMTLGGTRFEIAVPDSK